MTDFSRWLYGLVFHDRLRWPGRPTVLQKEEIPTVKACRFQLALHDLAGIFSAQLQEKVEFTFDEQSMHGHLYHAGGSIARISFIPRPGARDKVNVIVRTNLDNDHAIWFRAVFIGLHIKFAHLGEKATLPR